MVSQRPAVIPYPALVRFMGGGLKLGMSTLEIQMWKF